MPERVDATLPEAAAPPPAEAPGPAPAPLARGTRVRYKDGTLGSIAKCHHDDFPPYYDVALAGGRVVQCERGSLEVVDRRAAVEAKLRRRAPKEIRPALGAETVAAAGEALDALPLTAVAAALEPRGRSALAIAAARNDANLVTALRDRGAPPERRDFAGRTAADAAPSTRVARAVRFGAGDDATPALDFGRERGPVRPVDWDVYVAGAARTRTARAYDLGARELIFDDGKAVPVEDCDLRAGRSALDVYEPLRMQLQNQRVSSLAGALVDEIAAEFVLGFRDQGRELEREAAATERCAMSAEERVTRTFLAAEARAVRLEQLRLNVLAQETSAAFAFVPRSRSAPARATPVAPFSNTRSRCCWMRRRSSAAASLAAAAAAATVAGLGVRAPSRMRTPPSIAVSCLSCPAEHSRPTPTRSARGRTGATSGAALGSGQRRRRAHPSPHGGAKDASTGSPPTR